ALRRSDLGNGAGAKPTRATVSRSSSARRELVNVTDTSQSSFARSSSALCFIGGCRQPGLAADPPQDDPTIHLGSKVSRPVLQAIRFRQDHRHLSMRESITPDKEYGALVAQFQGEARRLRRRVQTQGKRLALAPVPFLEGELAARHLDQRPLELPV